MAIRRRPLDTAKLASLAASINAKQLELETAQTAHINAGINLDRLLTELDALKQEVQTTIADYIK